MVDIPSASAVIAAASVVAGVIYYSFQLRHQNKIRQTDVVMRLASSWKSKEFLEALLKVMSLEYKDYSDFVQKYGRPLSDTSIHTALYIIMNSFEEAGILLKRGLLDVDIALELLPTALVWKKLEPFMNGLRKEFGSGFGMYFEYLYNEMKKREQQTAKI